MKKLFQQILLFKSFFFPANKKETLKNNITSTSSVKPNDKELSEKPFDKTITDAEHLCSQAKYKDALVLYRALDDELEGTDELMKIQFVRDKIKLLVNKTEQTPKAITRPGEIVRFSFPNKDNNLEPTVRTFDEVLTEAEYYYSHELYKEALILYRALNAEPIDSNNQNQKDFITRQINSILEIIDDPLRVSNQQESISSIAYLDEDGSILEPSPEEDPKSSPSSSGIKKFTARLLKQRVFFNIIFILLIIIGVFSLFNSPVENMPSVDLGEVYITTYYYGASAEDVENLITIPVEKAVEGLEKVEIIKSRSYRNCSSVGIKFDDDSDYRELYSRLRLRVLNIRNKLPAGSEDPRFLFIDTHWWISVIQVNLFGEASEENRKQLAEKLKTELDSIEGIRDIVLTGETKNEFHISLSLEKLRKHGVTFSEVSEAVRSAGTKIPTGNFGTESSEFILDAGNVFSSQEEVLNVIIRRNGYGNFIRVSDVVTSALISHPDPMRLASINGKDTVSLIIRKEDNGNAIKIAKKVKAITSRFAKEHEKDGIKIIYTNDSTHEINEAINTLSGNMIFGIILVTLILWLTLGIRNAVLAAIGIPFSFLCTVIVMKMVGLSINSINLFAFILVSGIIVDDAIIIIENVHRHRQLGKPLRKAVIDGVDEVFWPVVSSALTTIMAFIPMLLITGSTGDFFAVIPLTVTFALIASLLEALVFLPLHIFEWGNRHLVEENSESGHEKENKADRMVFNFIWKIYKNLLELLLKNKAKTLCITFFLLLISVSMAVLSISGIFPFIKVKFFPGNYVRYHITVSLPASTPILRTDSTIKDISKFILSLGNKQAESVSGMAGYYENEDYSVLSGSNYGQVVVAIPERDLAEFPDNPENDPVKHIDYIRVKLNDYLKNKYKSPDERPMVKVFPENNGPASGKPVSIVISGNSLTDELDVSTRILDYLNNENETKNSLTELKDDRAAKINVVKYLPIQEAAYEYGISPGKITEVISGALNGYKASNFRAPTEEIDLKVRVARKHDKGGQAVNGLSNPQDILDLPMIEHSSSPVYLRDLVNVSYITEQDSRGRYNGKSTVTITAGIKSGSNLSPGRVKVLVNDYFNSISSEYKDITLVFKGESEASGKAFNSLITGFFIALMVIYLILAVQFGDYIQPLIVLSAVSFAVIGVTLGMFVTQSTFTVGSLMAMVGLAGVTVNDSLILIDFMNKRVDEGKIMRQAVLDACKTRMRPILITTITTIVGLLPMAIGIPYKSVEWSPMAMAFVTGLGSATLLTIFIIPLEYELAVKLRYWLKRVLEF